MARPSKRTKTRDDIFFAVYGSTGSILAAAEAASYSKSAVYRYLENDPNFMHRLEKAKIDTFDLIKGSAIDLAINGDESYKVLNLIDSKTGKKTTQVVKERKRSAAMIQFLAERMAPSEFDKDVKREKRQKAELMEEDWDEERSDELMNDFLGYLVDFKLNSISTDDLKERIQQLQEELSERAKT